MRIISVSELLSRDRDDRLKTLEISCRFQASEFSLSKRIDNLEEHDLAELVKKNKYRRYEGRCFDDALVMRFINDRARDLN